MNSRFLRYAKHGQWLEFFISYSLLSLSMIFALLPIAWMISTSLKTEVEALSLPIHWIPRHPTLKAYIEMWTLKPFATYFLNSTMVSGITALISTILGGLAGYGFSRFRFPGRIGLLTFFLTTQMISGVLVIGPYFRILVNVGLYNTLLGLI
ncbi:MAG: hypothetical protein QXP01_08025, partial [Candidatus Hadarchaeum sp.]